jgi:hypothetical protein
MPRAASAVGGPRARRSSSAAQGPLAQEFEGKRLAKVWSPDGRAPAPGDDASSSRVRDMLVDTFLPEGFPDSVTEDYLGKCAPCRPMHAAMQACNECVLSLTQRKRENSFCTDPTATASWIAPIREDIFGLGVVFLITTNTRTHDTHTHTHTHTHSGVACAQASRCGTRCRRCPATCGGCCPATRS